MLAALLLLSTAQYKVIDLGVEPELPAFLGATGMVAGMRREGAREIAFVWKDGKRQDLPEVEAVAGINGLDQLAVKSGGKPGRWSDGRFTPMADVKPQGLLPFPPGNVCGIDDLGRVYATAVGTEGV